MFLPIDGTAGVSVRIHLIHHLHSCSVKLSTQLQPYNHNGWRLQRVSPAQKRHVLSSFRGCGPIHDPASISSVPNITLSFSTIILYESWTHSIYVTAQLTADRPSMVRREPPMTVLLHLTLSIHSKGSMSRVSKRNHYKSQTVTNMPWYERNGNLAVQPLRPIQPES